MRTKPVLAVIVVLLLAGSVAVGPVGVAPTDTHEPQCMKQSETRDTHDQ